MSPEIEQLLRRARELGETLDAEFARSRDLFQQSRELLTDIKRRHPGWYANRTLHLIDKQPIFRGGRA